MPRRKWTPEEKKAFGEKMKALREAKKAGQKQTAGVLNPEPAVNPTSQNVEVSQSAPEINTDSEPTVSDLMKRIQELEQRQFFPQPAPQQAQNAQVTSMGLVGTTIKYSVNPKDYPDPRDRLFDEPKLKLKGFNRDWWDLEWNVSRANYETKDRINMSEPKFQVKLIRIIEDPETGEPSSKRYTLWKGTFFEDPNAAISIALQYGIEVGEDMQKSFLDEMRYLRIRDWLLEAFYPPKPSQDKMNKTETVIGNRLVEVYEANSVESTSIPFHNLKSKL